MKIFDLKGSVVGLSKPMIVSLLNSIELLKGKTISVENAKKVEKLKDIARRSEIMASCEVGNVFISEAQEKDLFEKGRTPESFQEFMVKGYQNAMELIDEVYKFQPFDRSFVSTLHYYMYKDYHPEVGGKFKDTQNYIQKILANGSYETVFIPAPPEDVVPLLDNLIYQFNECVVDEECNKLVLIACFILDFICIHPFNHGNGRLSRLLLNFLLRKYGYDIDSYFSLSYLIQHKLGAFIDSFAISSDNWTDGTNDYETYVAFLLKIILDAYRKLDYIIEINNVKGTVEEKALRIIGDSATPISKQVVQNILYSTSKAAIEKALSDLVKENRVQLITRGRYSKYFRA